VGAEAIYDLESEVVAFRTTDIARAVIDLNRAEDDRRKDGVVKTHTCWDVPIYSEPLAEEIVQTLLARHYRPYHAALRQLAAGVEFGLDCHTMAAVGPPVGPDPGRERPAVCLSNADVTCSRAAIEALADCLEHALGVSIAINDPFQGGYITRTHAAELPWVQIEFSRGDFLAPDEKRHGLCDALRSWCARGRHRV
jgi:formiminoglutamase